MRENRPYGSEGGAACGRPSLPLSVCALAEVGFPGDFPCLWLQVGMGLAGLRRELVKELL